MRRQLVDRDALLALADERLLRGVEPITLVPDIERTQQLGRREAIVSWVRGRDVRETSALLSTTCRRTAVSIGHSRTTHFVNSTIWSHRMLTSSWRDIPIWSARCHDASAVEFDLNTGTWARLI